MNGLGEWIDRLLIVHVNKTRNYNLWQFGCVLQQLQKSRNKISYWTLLRSPFTKRSGAVSLSFTRSITIIVIFKRVLCEGVDCLPLPPVQVGLKSNPFHVHIVAGITCVCIVHGNHMQIHQGFAIKSDWLVEIEYPTAEKERPCEVIEKQPW